MAYLCGNCGTPLVFDPGTQRVRCSTCNGKWFPEEVRTTACEDCGTPLDYDPLKKIAICRKCGKTFFPEQIKNKDREYLESIHAEPAEPPKEDVIAEFIDCFIYTCDSCGGKVAINSSEVSTVCVYCGSPTVVFERISRERAPEYILPFQINRELAVQNVRDELNKGKFVPKEIKNIEIKNVRGIYIPYWICDGIHAETCVHSRVVTKNYFSFLGGNNVDVEQEWYGDSGIMEFSNLPQDASRQMPDASTLRLEPFDMQKLIYFNEGYLLGFYSNLSDISQYELNQAVNKRMNVLFEQETMGFRDFNENKCKLKMSSTLIDQDVRYALLPVWFISFEYKGENHTMLVNGDSGKVVGGIPWNSTKFAAIVAAAGAGLSLICYWLIDELLSIPHYLDPARQAEAEVGNVHFVIGLFVAVALLFTYSMYKMRKIIKLQKLTKSKDIFSFLTKRQG